MIITIQNNQDEFDIQVNEHQVIYTSLEVLASRGLIDISGVNKNYIKLYRTDHYINIHLSFNEANIYNGDKLIIN